MIKTIARINKSLPLAALVAAAAFLAAAAPAQTATAPKASTAATPAKPSPYPKSSPATTPSSNPVPIPPSSPSSTPSLNPYQGVSQPPADDAITVTDEQPASSDASATTPSAAQSPAISSAPAAAPQPAVAAAPPSPELAPNDKDDSQDQTSPVLKSRSDQTASDASDGDDGIVTYVPGPANALPEGTIFRVSMLQDVSAETAIPGTAFRAKLIEDLKHNGQVVVPAGSELRGRIVRASTSRRIAGSSVIHLRPQEFILPSGARYRLEAEVIDTQGSNTKASGEGNIVPRSGARGALTDLAATSGGGAIVGASLAGPVGAAVGSAVGAGVETGVWLFQNRAADVSEESIVIFSLTDPMFLTAESSKLEGSR